jgi:antitoxin component YwqK of YwqJK toxin-antitoxin module
MLNVFCFIHLYGKTRIIWQLKVLLNLTEESESQYKPNQEFTGTWCVYRRNGDVCVKAEYVNGRREGKTTHYFQNGGASQTLSYRKDILSGIMRYYNRSGELVFMKKCNESGTLIWDREYSNGKFKEWLYVKE